MAESKEELKSLLMRVEEESEKPGLKLSIIKTKIMGFPGCSDDKESSSSAEDIGYTGLIPGSGGSLGGANGNPLQYSCLENSIDRGAWWATVHGVAESQTRLRD